MKKLDMLRGGVELFVGIGVTILVGGALAMVKPTELGAIKKLAVSAGAFAISSMAMDKVVEHVDKTWLKTEAEIKDLFKKPEEDDEEEEEV